MTIRAADPSRIASGLSAFVDRASRDVIFASVSIDPAIRFDFRMGIDRDTRRRGFAGYVSQVVYELQMKPRPMTVFDPQKHGCIPTGVKRRAAVVDGIARVPQTSRASMAQTPPLMLWRRLSAATFGYHRLRRTRRIRQMFAQDGVQGIHGIDQPICDVAERRST